MANFDNYFGGKNVLTSELKEIDPTITYADR